MVQYTVSVMKSFSAKKFFMIECPIRFSKLGMPFVRNLTFLMIMHFIIYIRWLKLAKNMHSRVIYWTHPHPIHLHIFFTSYLCTLGYQNE